MYMLLNTNVLREIKKYIPRHMTQPLDVYQAEYRKICVDAEVGNLSTVPTEINEELVIPTT